MKRVLKYNVPVDDAAHEVTVPYDSRFVHVACQHYSALEVQAWVEAPTWAEATASPERTWRLQVFGTGHPVPNGARYIGTALAANGALVWHLYDVTEAAS